MQSSSTKIWTTKQNTNSRFSKIGELLEEAG